MNGTQSLGALRQTISSFTRDIRTSRFFSDRISMSLLVAALVTNGMNLVFLVLRVRPTDSQVPVRFSSLTLFDALGPWYFPFVIFLFALVVTLVNTVFAYQSFGRSRLASFFLLTGSAVVAIFSFIISNALGAIR